MEEGKTNNPQASDKENIKDKKSYVEEASKFIEETSLDKMHEIAEAARLKKLMEPPKWVFPEDP
ncbi:MAG: hypothetical protein KME28_17800 [Pelatocladus maniniholoensis HA4357-MV3]|uniref:Uncharacterized protein n=1 Tax=Pelatocladus maniniholoensis HA4357-MV3 TaxID=1117104 RepID=A0A9E3H9U5_9NOST|nr:hypothetical protein [Pelatocladus maniniholoensis HA4357-MV3]BAZ68864.1 hypothetical protein NIES4106_36310 [Fischerella sp. NIES-4106]